MADVSPRCAKRDVEPGAPAGWCVDCVLEDMRERYGEKQHAAAWRRHEKWSERSRQTWDRDRQRIRRLKTDVRPREPLDHFDPWALGQEGLIELARIRTVRMRPEQIARLDVIAEVIRRLAWGPDDTA